MKSKKILSILLVIAFLVPWFAPLAHSFATQESNTENEAHYCEISKGPCKHGDACPLKDRHHKDKHPEHNKANEAKHAEHTRTGKDNVDGKTFFASECHKGEPAALKASFHFVRFAVTSMQISPHRNNIDQAFFFQDPALYNDAIPNLLERPPQDPLFRS